MEGQIRSNGSLNMNLRRANVQETESICREIKCPSLGACESCTNRSATVARSSDTMSWLRLYKLQPGKTAGRYWWCADNAAGPVWSGTAGLWGALIRAEPRRCHSATWKVLASNNNVHHDGVYCITFSAAHPCLCCWFISLQGLMVAWKWCKQYLQEHLIVETWEP